MYKHIQLHPVGALQKCSLENLEKVVVICGKNNSGKSTLLSAIQYGMSFLRREEIDAEAFKTCFDVPENWSRDSLYAIAGEVSQYKDIWTQDDASEFLRLFRERFSQYQFMGATPPKLHEHTIERIFKLQVGDQNPVIIPPKRNLELQDSIQTDRSVAPDGQGLLNFLFYAQNQFESASERKVYNEIGTLFQSISDGYEFTITTGKENDLKLSFRYNRSEWVPADACGLGLQDLLVLLFFIVSRDYDMLLIEEPESHLHPAMQRKLLNICRERSGKQFFFSTHSSVFLDLTLVGTILHTEMVDGEIKISNDTSRAVVLDSLGYSVTDNLVSDLIILVEGPSDKPVIEEFLRQMGLYSSHSIKIWPLGGDIMSQCDLTVFAEKHKLLALIDRDPGSSRERSRFMKNCADLGIEVHQLQRKAIENYFTLDALKKIFHTQIPADVVEIDPKTKLEAQIGLNVKKSNLKIAQNMSLKDIRNTDLYTFLENIRTVLQG